MPKIKKPYELEYYDGEYDDFAYERDNIEIWTSNTKQIKNLMKPFYKYRLHRTDGPAFLEYDGMGNLIEECWYKNNKKHRTDGPAQIFYLDDYEYDLEEYYFINGKKLSKKEFETIQKINLL